MEVNLSSRLEIPRGRFKEKNKVVNDGSTLSTNTIHSHDTRLRLVNELIKLNDFNDFLSFAELTK